MARRKYEFQPDKTRLGLLHKLYLTKRQRRSILRWGLFSLIVLVLSVIQDVILCRATLFGGATDLVPGVLMVICVLLGAEEGCVFTLICAALFQFSGSAPGHYVIALIPCLGIGMALLRQIFLNKHASSNLLCSGVAIALYELLLFIIGMVTGRTTLVRWASFLATTVMTVGISFALYPVLSAIERIGGETWRD